MGGCLDCVCMYGCGWCLASFVWLEVCMVWRVSGSYMGKKWTCQLGHYLTVPAEVAAVSGEHEAITRFGGIYSVIYFRVLERSAY